jgi:acetyl esterase/lipase
MMSSVTDVPAPTIHPELRTLAKVLPRGLSTRTVRVVRRLEGLQARAEQRSRRSGKHQGPEVIDLGGAGLRVHRPRLAVPGPLPALLWIHGGGYVIGTAAQEDAFCRRFANELGAVVAAVEYRLAPEHPYPTPLEDCHDALEWLAAQSDVDPMRIAIGGASAGGGLAAALALLARDRGRVRPVFQLLTYPMLDDRTVRRSDVDERGFRLWNNRSNAMGWQSYLGAEPGSDAVPADAVPARREDLEGLAPAWIGVGTQDLFLDEDVAYAQRLRDAGVPCTLDVVDGAFHAFDYLAPGSEPSRRFRDAQLDALADAFWPVRTSRRPS